MGVRFKTKKIVKNVLWVLLLGLVAVVAIVLFADWKISHDTKKYIYNSADSIPNNSIALILGTSRYIGSTPNLYFTYRIQAAKELYETGKVQAFVVSGDNRHTSYNEPRDMTQALVKAGVPDSIINMDFAGFRTLDSVVRMRKVFGQKSFIIISQEFHNQRAIFIARHHGIDAYGYNARDLGLNRASYRTKVRELFARVKVFVDILFGVNPKFLGDPIEIVTAVAPIDSLNCSDTTNKPCDSLCVSPK